MVDAQRVSDVWTPCMPIYRDQLQNLIGFFSERPAGARRIFHIQISTTETFKSITHGTISYSILALNSTNFSACYSLFYSEKASHGVFLQEFHSFSNFYKFQHKHWTTTLSSPKCILKYVDWASGKNQVVNRMRKSSLSR